MNKTINEDLKDLGEGVIKISKKLLKPVGDWLNEKKEEMQEENKVYKKEIRKLRLKKARQRAKNKVYGKNNNTDSIGIVPNNLGNNINSPLMEGDLYGK